MLRTFACMLVLGLGGCAGGPEIPPDTVFISQAEHQRLKQAAKEAAESKARIASMEERLAALRTTMDAVLTRSALKPYKPKRLVPMPGGPSLASLSDVTWIEKRGERPEKLKLSSIVRSSQATIISFWATWCVPCISDEELKHLRDLKRQLARYNVSVLPMAIDDLDKVMEHPKAGKWLYPLWFKKGGHIEIMPQAFIQNSGMGLPLFAVIDRSGMIRYVYQRKLDDDLVNELVDASLSL